MDGSVEQRPSVVDLVPTAMVASALRWMMVVLQTMATAVPPAVKFAAVNKTHTWAASARTFRYPSKVFITRKELTARHFTVCP